MAASVFFHEAAADMRSSSDDPYSRMPSPASKKMLVGHDFFFPGESHTLAGLLRSSLPAPSEGEPASCVVSEALNEVPGVTVRCASRQGLLAAIDDARAWVQSAREATSDARG